MRLFLIRHGETVDNVAGLYAGSRDSALTNHGVEQTRRLGQFLAVNRPCLTHVFASPLQRAFKTAQAVASAQSSELNVIKVADLVEQDFGYYEGKPFSARSRDSNKSGKDDHKNDPGFVDVESKGSLARRSDAFLDGHLLPLFDVDGDHVVVIVSHGILLSHLWRRLLLRLQAKSVTVAPDIVASKGQPVLEHLGGWSNTGFLELLIQRVDDESTTEPDQAESSEVNVHDDSNSPSDTPNLPATVPTQLDPIGDVSLNKADDSQPPPSKKLKGYHTTILTIDGKPHLTTLKRTRGGIGRAIHDEKQKTVDSFFKKARKD